MTTDLLLEKNRAIMAYVEKSIIPIVCDHTQDGKRTAGTCGTGSLFEFDGKYFLLTASHLFDAVNEVKDWIGIPVAQRNSEIYTLDKCVLSRPDTAQEREKYDIAILRLDDSIAKEMKRSYKFLTYANVDRVRYNEQFYVSGFPFTFSKLFVETNQVVGIPFRFMSRHKSPSQEDYRWFDPAVHILVEYSETYYENGINPRPVAAPSDLEGISGCSIWNYEDDPKGIWAPETCLKVVGIQTGVRRGSYIKGTKWGYVINGFASVDQAIYQKLVEAIKAK
jgi:hypothetical protein